MSSALIALGIARRIREASEANPQTPQPKEPKVQKSSLTISSFIFFLVSLVLAAAGLLTGFLPLALLAISIGIGSVALAVLSLRDL